MMVVKHAIGWEVVEDQTFVVNVFALLAWHLCHVSLSSQIEGMFVCGYVDIALFSFVFIKRTRGDVTTTGRSH